MTGQNHNIVLQRTGKTVGGWVGRWCWVASSAGASYNLDIW